MYTLHTQYTLNVLYTLYTFYTLYIRVQIETFSYTAYSVYEAHTAYSVFILWIFGIVYSVHIVGTLYTVQVACSVYIVYTICIVNVVYNLRFVYSPDTHSPTTCYVLIPLFTQTCKFVRTRNSCFKRTRTTTIAKPLNSTRIHQHKRTN